MAKNLGVGNFLSDNITESLVPVSHRDIAMNNAKKM